MHACDGQTDRQTDRILLAIPRLHYMHRGKNRRLGEGIATSFRAVCRLAMNTTERQQCKIYKICKLLRFSLLCVCKNLKNLGFLKPTCTVQPWLIDSFHFHHHSSMYCLLLYCVTVCTSKNVKRLRRFTFFVHILLIYPPDVLKMFCFYLFIVYISD